MKMSESSSAFIVPSDFSNEWHDITLVHRRTHTLVYTATRYGRRYLLKALVPEEAQLTDFRLQQEQEFQLGVVLVHPNIAATYSLEEVPTIGRCIVQEWIDGMTLGEWLQSKPSRVARERVFGQILDALEYIHGLQLVHHDLKADNILITHNGTNVKLIDFGLSATDATLSPVDNNPCTDIQALGRLLPVLMPRKKLLARRCRYGRYTNIAAIRRDLKRSLLVIRMVPIVCSTLLLMAAALLFYITWHERHAAQQRHEEMVALVDYYLEEEKEQLTQIVNSREKYDFSNPEDLNAYMACSESYTACIQHYWALRDSLADTYGKNDQLSELLWQMWVHREVEINNELYPQLTEKICK